MHYTTLHLMQHSRCPFLQITHHTAGAVEADFGWVAALESCVQIVGVQMQVGVKPIIGHAVFFLPGQNAF